MRVVFILFVLLSVMFSAGAQTVFNETIGTPGGTTPVGTYTGYSNYPTLTYTGSADVRNTGVSSGYAGASGGGNVFVTGTVGTNFQISNINTSSYTSLSLSFGHFKSTTTGNNELVVEVSSDGTSYTPLTYSRPTGAGTASWILVSPTGTIPSTANLRIRFRQTTTATQFRIDDIILTGTLIASCSDPGEPTTVSTSLTTTPSCASATINWSTVAGNGTNHLVLVSSAAITTPPSDNVIYTASTTFGTGGSTIAGAQVMYTGTGNSVTITGLTEGTLYNVAIFEFNLALPTCSNYTSSSNSGSFTTLTGCGPVNPEILGILANSCDVAEGLNEFFVFQNGTSPLSLSSMTVTFPTLGFDYCNSGCGTNTLLNNASAISSLNTAAGCSLFAFADPIPASATVVVFTGNPPTAPPNFSAQCGQQYYAIFCNNPSTTTGRFANSGTGLRTLSVNFGSSTDAVSYDLGAMSNVDGEYISFDYAGNPSYTVLTNCAGPLAVTLTTWQGMATPDGNLISWTVESSVNNSHFMLMKSTDGMDFNNIAIVYDEQQDGPTNYTFLDRNVTTEISYYQLLDVDYNGTVSASPVIAVQGTHNAGDFSISNGYIIYSDWSEITELALCDASGKVLFHTTNALQQDVLPLNSGIYFIQARAKSGKTINQKLFVNGNL